MHTLGLTEDGWYALPREERVRHVAFMIAQGKANAITAHIVQKRRENEAEMKRKQKGKR